MTASDQKTPGSPSGVLTRTRTKTQRPPLYKVLLLNDDYTPMEFVVHVLERFFGINHQQAVRDHADGPPQGPGGGRRLLVRDRRDQGDAGDGLRPAEPAPACSAPWRGTSLGRPAADRLALAFATGVLAVPATGRILVLGATPSAFLDALPRDRLVVEQGFRPLHDALAARGLPVDGAGRGTGGAGRGQARPRAGRATSAPSRAVWRCCRRAARWCVDGAKTDGIDSLARQLAGGAAAGGDLRQGARAGRSGWTGPARFPPRSPTGPRRRRRGGTPAAF